MNKTTKNPKIAKRAPNTEQQMSEVGSTKSDCEQLIYKATHGSPDRPLKLGGMQIPCYVLEDSTRVLTGRDMQQALALGYQDGLYLNAFLNRPSLEPYLSEDLRSAIAHPIRFTRPDTGRQYW